MGSAGRQIYVAVEKKKCYADPYSSRASSWPAEPNGRLCSGLSDPPVVSGLRPPGLLTSSNPSSAKHPAVVLAVFDGIRVSKRIVLNATNSRFFSIVPSATYTSCT
jgi:hypothetical protein